LSQHRQQRETDRHNLNKAIGLDDDGPDDIQANYQRMKENVRQVEESLGIKDERAERLAELERAQVELRSQLVEQQQSAPVATEAELTLRQNAEVARQQILNGFAQQYPEVYSPQAWASMEQSNPNRAAAAKQFLAQCDGIYRDHVNQLAQAVPQHLEWRNAENRKFDEAHPELKDGHVRQKIQEAAVRVLKKNGASDQEIRQAAVNGLPFAAQETLLQAAKYELAQEARGKSTGRRNVAPAPQRPGVSNAPRSRADNAVSQASAAMDKAPSVKNAARMLAAMRRAR
jgi:hypothetical protein